MTSTTTQVTKNAESASQAESDADSQGKGSRRGGRGRRQPAQGSERRDCSTQRQKRRIVREALAPGVAAAARTSGAAAPKNSVKKSAGLDIGPVSQQTWLRTVTASGVRDSVAPWGETRGWLRTS